MLQYADLPKSSVSRALNNLGDRWSQLIVQEAFLGTTRFEEFRASTGIPRSTLSNRLQALMRNGVLTTHPCSEGARRVEYVLSERGLDLFNTLLMAWSWAMRWDMTTQSTPSALIHHDCGKAMIPKMVCAHCDGAVTLSSCRYTQGPGAGTERIAIQRMHRRRLTGATRGDTAAGNNVDVNDLLGDRWLGLIISAQYFGIHRFDEIQSTLGIATNILADRLRILLANGIFDRRLYEVAPNRYEYLLTKKGTDLYPHALTLLTWGDKWLDDGLGPPVVIYHKPCDQKLETKVVCNVCRGTLTPHNTLIRR